MYFINTFTGVLSEQLFNNFVRYFEILWLSTSTSSICRSLITWSAFSIKKKVSKTYVKNTTISTLYAMFCCQVTREYAATVRMVHAAWSVVLKAKRKARKSAGS